jgi:FkbM family methyltransferase
MKEKLSPISIIYGNIVVSKNRLILYLNAVKNPLFTLLKISLFKPPWDIVLRTNEKRRILDKNDLFETVYLLNHPLKGPEVQYTLKDTDVTVKLKTVRGNDGSEVFEQNIYDWLPVADKIVIDIGASIGDSSLYFALKGAKHVFAYEACTDIYNVALFNIKMNSYQDPITVENRMVIGGANDFASTESGKANMKPIILDEIIKEYEIKDAVLKIDCEGCEYGVILSTSADTIRHFSHIQMEYHFGMKKLKKRLTDIGYDVKVSHNRYSKSPDTRMLMKAGDLYATRVRE